MSSVLRSQGVVIATAMAVSGTIILLAFRLQKSQYPSPRPVLRPGRSFSDGEEKKRAKKKGKKKKVHFAKDVAEPRGDGEDFRKQHNSSNRGGGTIIVNSCKSSSPNSNKMAGGGVEEMEMPANRVALYNGILRERMFQRLAYCY